MKIYFITPASDFRRSKIYRVGNRIYGPSNPITGPLILGSILKKTGHDVEVYEELFADVNYKKMSDGDVFCLYTMSSNAPRAYYIADKLHRETNARVIIGGIHASVLPEEALEHADQVIVGEGENVILDLIEGRLTNRIVYASGVMNLDEVPFPDYSILKTPCTTANVMSTRGCPYCCSFCTTSRMFYSYRERSVDNVIKELRYCKELGFKYMNFEDDNFTADKERTKEICRRMIEEGLVFKETFFFGRTDLANDEEMLDLLEKAHLNCVLVGIESLNQDSLDLINKRQNITDIENCAKALSRHKIRLIASLVLGIDTDSEQDIQRGVDFAKKIHAYQLQPAILTPFFGTDTYKKYQEENRIITNDWAVYDMMHVTFLPKKMTPWQLQQQFNLALKRFYTFSSSFEIMRTFGMSYGLRRMVLQYLLKLGLVNLKFTAYFRKNTHLYKLKHFSGLANYPKKC